MSAASFYGGQSGGHGQGGGYPPRPAGYDNQTYNNQRPNPPEPWVTEWDNQASTWIFINRQSGERTHQFPQGGRAGGSYSQSYSASESYQQQGGYGGPPPPHQQQQQQQPQQKSHAGRNMALAGVGGLLAGGLLMHEGHKVEEKWDEDKARFEYDKDRVEDNYDYGRDRVEDRVDYDRDRFEDRVDYDQARFDDRVDYERDRFDDRVAYDVDRVEDFPDDAARWTGRKVQEVEDFPEDVAGWAGRKVQEVEDIPEDVAGWAGRKVQGVEDFADNIDDAYDDGRAQQEYRDDSRYDDDRW